MQWTPEHAQWAEQHFDISSTTRSPAHKAEAYRGHLQRTYQYAWANDDISALTASNLLKKYAENMGSSPGLEPSYSNSNCGGLHPGLPAQEYVAGYNGSYLQSSYSGQPASALPSPHPSPLHSAGLLQPPPTPASSTDSGAWLQHWVSQPLQL
ncbi:hypothetical protein SKAU_G00237430 [Synaphobranchus kaupii]|uniref:Uncharacterized protein n=1 Tax=Synaphobranchus kaupii TaxID=118154 RepID=A0A9Q1F6S9_SYNKA|nr:hypothetical protein SKAU_G00237430 [Synaphobranchus kaupii]